MTSFKSASTKPPEIEVDKQPKSIKMEKKKEKLEMCLSALSGWREAGVTLETFGFTHVDEGQINRGMFVVETTLPDVQPQSAVVRISSDEWIEDSALTPVSVVAYTEFGRLGIGPQIYFSEMQDPSFGGILVMEHLKGNNLNDSEPIFLATNSVFKDPKIAEATGRLIGRITSVPVEVFVKPYDDERKAKCLQNKEELGLDEEDIEIMHKRFGGILLLWLSFAPKFGSVMQKRMKNHQPYPRGLLQRWAGQFRKVVDIPFRSKLMSKVAVGHFDLHPLNLMFKEASKDPCSIRAVDFDACSTMPVAYNFQGVLTSTKMSIEERKILVAAYLKEVGEHVEAIDMKDALYDMELSVYYRVLMVLYFCQSTLSSDESLQEYSEWGLEFIEEVHKMLKASVYDEQLRECIIENQLTSVLKPIIESFVGKVSWESLPKYLLCFL